MKYKLIKKSIEGNLNKMIIQNKQSSITPNKHLADEIIILNNK